jgi:C4-dicarboxylate transporter DctM subunit
MMLGVLALLVVCILLGEPLYVLIGAIAAWLLLSSGQYGTFAELTSIVELTRKLSDNEVLLAIPFFVLSGALMAQGDIARRLIATARAVFGWLPGGLAVSSVAACIFFAAISGSSPVTVIAIGSIMYPAMIKEGFSERFSGGLVTSAGSLGILIPPSIPMIVYAIIDPMELEDPPNYNIDADGTGLGLVELFLAGVGPGILIGGILAIYGIYTGFRTAGTRSDFAFEEVLRSFRQGFWSLMLPVIILGGIYSGVFTPTQAAAVSVIYALIVEVWVHRSLQVNDLPRILGESTVLIGSLLIILALAQGFNKYLELAGVAEEAVEFLLEWELSPLVFLLLVNLLLLVVGAFMDILSAILILVPLLSPIAFQLGIHPIHLAVIFIVNLEIGYLTPPLGLNLFVASTIFRKSIGEVVRSMLPFIGLMIIGLLMVTYIPAISLGPVALYRGSDPAVGFPERHVGMKTAELPEALKFLSGVAAQYEDADEEEDDAPPPDRPLTMAELLEQNRRNMERDAMNELAYDTLEELLGDYTAVYSRRTRLRDLTALRELGVDIDELVGDSDEDDED